jgi:hypothetical protein
MVEKIPYRPEEFIYEGRFSNPEDLKHNKTMINPKNYTRQQ